MRKSTLITHTTCFLFTSDGASNEAKSAARFATYNKWQHVVVYEEQCGYGELLYDGAPLRKFKSGEWSPTNSGTNNVFIGNDDPLPEYALDGLMDTSASTTAFPPRMKSNGCTSMGR